MMKITTQLNNMKNQDGFIARIVLIVVALIAIKYYFHFDIVEWIKSDQGQKIVSPIVSFSKNLYTYMDNLVGGWVGK